MDLKICFIASQFDNNKMQRFFIFTVLLFTYSLFSQESFIFEQYNTPFVFDLEFQSYGKKVLLTWKNPDNFHDNLIIYRSDSYISNLQNAKRIARLTNGENKFIDNIESGNYYYAVLIEDRLEINKIYMLFVPYRNITVKPVVLTEENNIKLTSIKAYPDRNINLQWDFIAYDSDETNRLVYIFRSNAPIENEEAFENAVFALKTNLRDRNAVDTLSENIPYYYYIWIEGSVPVFLPDVTYTTKAYCANAERKFLHQKEELKFTPLPLLVFRKDPLTGKKLNRSELENIQNKDNKLSDFRNDMQKKWTSNQKKIDKEYHDNCDKMLPFSFLKDEEIYVPPFYKDKYENIQTFLLSKDYKTAKTELENLLSDGLPKQFYERVNYYLGMINYCLGDFYNSYLYLNSTSGDINKTALPYLRSLSDKIYEALK